LKTLLAISFVLMVGAAGVTVAAAQGIQPGEPIHAIKVWSEQARTLLQSQAAQMTGQSGEDPAQADRDRIQLQTQDMLQTQERDRLQLQAQDTLQTQARDRIQLQTQDCVQQSLNSAQQSPAGNNPGQGNDGAGNGPNPMNGHRP
jgi:hypothetical protein